MPSVLDAQFGVAAEATYGTPVTVSRFYEIASGDGFEYRPNRVQGGGLRVNDAQETDANRTLTTADLVDGVIKLAAGKKKIVLVKPV